jgi:gas vesicle protein
MKSKDQQMLEEAYQKVQESTSLRDPELTDEQAQKLVIKHNELKSSIKSLKDKMADPHYKDNFGPHDRLDDSKRLKELEQALRAVRKKYYGN